mmetsp:Transcript_1619/g.4934  ORF Transcript_1619/g.4934 Transcript_1619/m.4934 type:complete len:299 (+) Transcript_1619:126-1022(+)
MYRSSDSSCRRRYSSRARPRASARRRRSEARHAISSAKRGATCSATTRRAVCAPSATASTSSPRLSASSLSLSSLSSYHREMRSPAQLSSPLDGSGNGKPSSRSAIRSCSSSGSGPSDRFSRLTRDAARCAARVAASSMSPRSRRAASRPRVSRVSISESMVGAKTARQSEGASSAPATLTRRACADEAASPKTSLHRTRTESTRPSCCRKDEDRSVTNNASQLSRHASDSASHSRRMASTCSRSAAVSRREADTARHRAAAARTTSADRRVHSRRTAPASSSSRPNSDAQSSTVRRA